MTEVKFRKGTLEEVANMPIVEGAITFQIEDGIIFLDVNGERIEFSSVDRISEMQSSILNTMNTFLTKRLFFSEGEEFTLNSRMVVDGYLSGGSTVIYFAIPTPKLMSGLTPVLNEITLSTRPASGGYLLSGITQDTFDGTIAIDKSTDNLVLMRLTANTAFSATNNTPVSIQIDNLNITFSSTATASEINDESEVSE